MRPFWKDPALQFVWTLTMPKFRFMKNRKKTKKPEFIYEFNLGTSELKLHKKGSELSSTCVYIKATDEAHANEKIKAKFNKFLIDKGLNEG